MVSRCALVSVVSLQAASGLFAGLNASNTVVYDPSPIIADGVLPIDTTKYAVPPVIRITSPGDAAFSYPRTITLVAKVNKSPGDPNAINYLTFSPASFTFDGPNKTQTVAVELKILDPDISGGTVRAGAYGYQVYSISNPAWPGANGIDYVDLGFSVNSTVSIAAKVVKPTVTITAPTALQVITVAPTAMPATVEMKFNATAPAADPVTGIDADLAGATLVSATFSNGATLINPSNAINTTVANLGSASAQVSTPMTISIGGTYIANASGTNLAGTTTPKQSVQFTVYVTPLITTTAVPAFTVGQPVSFQIAVSPLTYPAAKYSISSGTLPPGVTLNPTTGEVSGTPTAAGSATPVTITATNYVPGSTTNVIGAASQAYSIPVSKGTPTVTWTPSSPITYGTALSSLSQLNATASVPGSFAYDRAVGAVLGVGTYTLSATFTPANTDNYNPVTATATLKVNKATPTIAWGNPTAITYGTALSTTQLNATANVSGAFTYTPDAPTKLNAGLGQTLSAIFTPTDTANYTAANASVKIDVNKTTLTVTAANGSKTYGQSVTFNGATQFTSSGLQNGEIIGTVTLTSGGAAATAGVSGSPYTITASGATGGTFNPANYNITYISGALTVDKATLTVTAANGSKIYGQTFAFNGATQFTSNGLQNSETIGTVTLTSGGAAATAGVSGSPYTITASGATGGTFKPANYNITYVTGTLTVTKANQTITFAALPAKKVSDAAFTLTATASSGLAVTYTSSNPAVATVSGSTVTIVGAGATTITANQPGDTNYNAAPAVPQALTVTTGPNLTLTIAKPVDGSVITRVAGSPDTPVTFEFTAVASGGDTVKSLSAKLGSKNLTVSSARLPVATATGTGTFTVNAAGTYTFTASAKSTGGLTKEASVTFQVKETQPEPQPCKVVLHWLPPISLDKEVQQGGSVVPVKFHLHQCCNSSSGSGHDDDDDDDHHGNGGDDDDDDDHHGSSNGNSNNSHDCDRDGGDDDNHDGWKDNGNGHCPLIKDTTVIITIYEVGKQSQAVHYTYSANGNPNLPTYAIDGGKQYLANFTTAKGVHTYHIDVDYFPNGSRVPVLLASKEFKTK